MCSEYEVVVLRAGMDNGEHFLLYLRIARFSISERARREGDRLILLQ